MLCIGTSVSLLCPVYYLFVTYCGLDFKSQVTPFRFSEAVRHSIYFSNTRTSYGAHSMSTEVPSPVVSQLELEADKSHNIVPRLSMSRYLLSLPIGLHGMHRYKCIFTCPVYYLFVTCCELDLKSQVTPFHQLLLPGVLIFIRILLLIKQCNFKNHNNFKVAN